MLALGWPAGGGVPAGRPLVFAHKATVDGANRWIEEARKLKDAGNYELAIQLRVRGAGWVVKRPGFGEGSKEHAAALHNLGQLYAAAGRYAEAEPLYKRSLDIHEAKSGRD